MKRPYLLLLAFIPLFPSCGQNGSFPNPFSDDKYKPIGFKLDSEAEKISRPLTNDETNIVKYTIDNKDKYDDLIMSNIENETTMSTRYTRDYTLAFAGVFKQGYNVSNTLKNEKFYVTRQKDNSPSSLTDYSNLARTKTHNESHTISQYSYGEITEDVIQNDYVYYGNGSEGKAAAEALKNDATSLNKRTERTQVDSQTSKYTKVTDTILLKEGKEKTEEVNDYFYIRQSNYITTPDSKSGADKDGYIILVTATQNQHKGKEGEKVGVFTLEDGRSYQAMDNSLVVSKLKIETEESSKTKWCRAVYARVYKEIVITSEVIQPNVPVTKLKTPIAIHFSEEKNYFNLTKVKEESGKGILGKLPEVTE